MNEPRPCITSGCQRKAKPDFAHCSACLNALMELIFRAKPKCGEGFHAQRPLRVSA